MLTLEQFTSKLLSLTEYGGNTILRREIGYAVSNPDTYLFYSDKGYYSCRDEYEKYCDAYKKFAWIIQDS